MAEMRAVQDVQCVQDVPERESGPRSGLAQSQADLVAALTGTGPVPPGFASDRVEVARKALLRKRSGEIAGRWPLLAAGLGNDFGAVFADWAQQRPTAGSLRDGWDLASELHRRHALPPLARAELAGYRVSWRDRDGRILSLRRWPAVANVDGVWAVQVTGRCWIFRRS